MKIAEIVDSILEGEDIMEVFQEKLWSAKVKTTWTPPAGLFTKSAADIAKGVTACGADLQTAMSRINFYVNRAGKNLSAERKAELDSRQHCSQESGPALRRRGSPV